MSNIWILVSKVWLQVLHISISSRLAGTSSGWWFRWCWCHRRCCALGLLSETWVVLVLNYAVMGCHGMSFGNKSQKQKEKQNSGLRSYWVLLLWIPGRFLQLSLSQTTECLGSIKPKMLALEPPSQSGGSKIATQPILITMDRIAAIAA